MELAQDYSWSTHQPLLYSLLECFEPEFVLELGVGLYSTPIFSNDQNIKKLISVENDKEWYEHILKNINFKSNHELFWHDLKELNKYMFLKDLNESQIKRLKENYEDIYNTTCDSNYNLKLLFVDNFTCCRTIAINTLYKYFDIIVYHDAEGVDWYDYDKFDEDLILKYHRYILQSERSWTGCFIKNDLKNLKYVSENIKQYIQKYCIENNSDISKMRLV